MANASDDDRCPGCGAQYVLLGGRVHRCSGRLLRAVAEIAPAPREVPVAAPVVGIPTTYRHRDPEARRAYMREFMRRKRSQENSSGAAADGG